MDDLNISMDLFRENFIELLTGDNEKRFTALPTPIKSAFTRAYNHTHTSSIKPIKKSKRVPGDPSSIKNFDPMLQDEPSESEMEEEEEDNNVAAIGKGGKPAVVGKTSSKTRGGSAPAPSRGRKKPPTKASPVCEEEVEE